MFGWLTSIVGRALAVYLSKPIKRYESFSAYDAETLKSVLEPGDILLVDGNLRFSTAIKYLTQSTWSHAAMFVGDVVGAPTCDVEPCQLIEADLLEGVIAVPVSKYADFNSRICRPIGLTPPDRQALAQFMVKSLGKSYDHKNVVDLLRYLLPIPPVSVRLRRRMLAFGSGDPTRAICSTLIAQAYQSIRYPLLPCIERQVDASEHAYKELLHIRHHSLFAPRDFDVSPYFQIVKPTLERGFRYKELTWVGSARSDERKSISGPPSGCESWRCKSEIGTVDAARIGQTF
jgi:hypothetical protein